MLDAIALKEVSRYRVFNRIEEIEEGWKWGHWVLHWERTGIRRCLYDTVPLGVGTHSVGISPATSVFTGKILVTW